MGSSNVCATPLYVKFVYLDKCYLEPATACNGTALTELLQAPDATAPLLRRLFTACVGPHLVELR
jgi:hypothetical protein